MPPFFLDSAGPALGDSRREFLVTDTVCDQIQERIKIWGSEMPRVTVRVSRLCWAEEQRSG